MKLLFSNQDECTLTDVLNYLSAQMLRAIPDLPELEEES